MDQTQAKKLLTEEKQTLEVELSSIARPDSQNAEHWLAKQAESEEAEFRDEVADRMEEQDDRDATITPLEKRWHEVKAALARLEAGTYGLCQVCGQTIEADRLTANPAATTCKTHVETK